MKPISVIDHLVSKEVFTIAFDQSLGAWKTTPQLTEEALKEYYPKDSYASHQTKATNIKTALYLAIKSYNNRLKLKWINKVCVKGVLLDVGAGNGAFVSAATKQGWDAYAHEMAPSAIAQIEKKGIKHTSTPFEGKNYNVITLWHAFEHLPNPEEKLSTFFDVLVPGGILVLALPNIDAWDAKHYKGNWAAYDVPRHLWHYNKASILRLANQAGFINPKIHNMFWDAFYISLLSEQYANAKFPWTRALFKGMYSTLVGWMKKNTSSLTFILQKPK